MYAILNDILYYTTISWLMLLEYILITEFSFVFLVHHFSIIHIISFFISENSQQLASSPFSQHITTRQSKGYCIMCFWLHIGLLGIKSFLDVPCLSYINIVYLLSCLLCVICCLLTCDLCSLLICFIRLLRCFQNPVSLNPFWWYTKPGYSK